MDTGHYNCRDYYISPHISPATITNDSNNSHNGRRAPIFRHESWEELELRSRSPASVRPKFPLLRLPQELRQEIFSYLLPRTKVLGGESPNLLAAHARQFSAVKKRGERGMHIPTPAAGGSAAAISNIVWQRGNTSLFGVCRQIHDEYAEMVYGRNTFLLFVTFGGISFRFRWLLPSGLAPTKRVPFIELVPAKYLKLIKKAVVHIDHVDSYTAMIKFNVGGPGLTHGLRRQVQRLVNVLRPDSSSPEEDESIEKSERRLVRLDIRVSNGNAVVDQIRTDVGKHLRGCDDREKGNSERFPDDIAEMLAPFQQLRGVRTVSVSGAVPDGLARTLEASMLSTKPWGEGSPYLDTADGGPHEPNPRVPLCVYGNDID